MLLGPYCLACPKVLEIVETALPGASCARASPPQACGRPLTGRDPHAGELHPATTSCASEICCWLRASELRDYFQRTSMHSVVLR
jgi:hypothetical protein